MKTVNSNKKKKTVQILIAVINSIKIINTWPLSKKTIWTKRGTCTCAIQNVNVDHTCTHNNQWRPPNGRVCSVFIVASARIHGQPIRKYFTSMPICKVCTTFRHAHRYKLSHPLHFAWLTMIYKHRHVIGAAKCQYCWSCGISHFSYRLENRLEFDWARMLSPLLFILYVDFFFFFAFSSMLHLVMWWHHLWDLQSRRHSTIILNYMLIIMLDYRFYLSLQWNS